MSCTTCSIGNGSTPAGCKSNGYCATGACNKLNTFDWLNDLSAPPAQESFNIVEVTFKNGSRKEFCKNNKNLNLITGDWVVIDTGNGQDTGQITLSGELVRLQMKKKEVREDDPEIKKIIRRAVDADLKKLSAYREKEQETLVRARAMARQLNLDMKLGDVEYQGDGKKATFYFTADGRVDFRELIKEYAKSFKIKVEMRQIGARQESGRIGGIGDCGRELCCATWLTDFKTVSTSAARYQNLAINQAKLSGQCGRLKCCLNYELDTYLDAVQDFPENADKIDTQKGEAFLYKTDIFKKIMWFSYSRSATPYPLSTETVKKALEQNARGKKAPELSDLKVEMQKEEEEEVYEDLTGQISLESLDKKRKSKGKRSRRKKR